MNCSNLSRSLKKNPITIFINVEMLFDLKSILFSIARFTNEKYHFRANLSQNIFNSLKFTNIDEFVNSFFNDITQQKENSEKESENNEDKENIIDNFHNILKQNILGNKIFNTAKPKLYTISQLYYLTNELQKLGCNDIEISIYSREKYYVEVLKDSEIFINLGKIFANVRHIKLIKIEEINSTNNSECKLNILEDNKNEEENKIKNNSNSIENDNNELIIFIDDKIEDLQKKIKCNDNYNKNNILFYHKQININKNKEEEKKIENNSKNNDFMIFTEYENLIERINTINSLNDKISETNSEFKSFKEFIDKEFIFKYSKEFINYNFKFLPLWRNTQTLNPFIIEGKVVPGFKRGSKLLGVPTANISTDVNLNTIQTGVYYGPFRFKEDMINKNTDEESKSDFVYSGVLSIGYNPYFDNNCKTIEVFLTDYEGEDFYDKEIILTIQGFIRTEASFENFSELVTAITYDIITSNQLL